MMPDQIDLSTSEEEALDAAWETLLGKSITSRKRIVRSVAKGKGQPCKPGETKARSGCIPKKKPEGGGKKRSEKPSEKPKERRRIVRDSEKKPRTSTDKPSIPDKATQDQSIEGIKQHLQQITSMLAGHTSVTPPAKVVLDHGRKYYVDENSYPCTGKQKMCYMNAANMVMADSSLTYVEGFIDVHGVPIQHAWAVDAQGKVIDPTIRPGSGMGGYFGVPFKREYLLKTLAKTGYYGLISHTNMDLLAGEDKEFTAPPKPAFTHKPVNPEGRDTQQAYKTGPGYTDYSPERVEAVHKPAYEKVLSGVKEAEGPLTMFMTGGGGGSGKSVLVGPLRGNFGYPEKDKVAHIDPDMMKGEIPEYREHARVGDEFAGDISAFVHEESSDMALTCIAEGLKARKHVLYDSTGDSSTDKLEAKVKKFREMGAERVEINYVFPGSVEEAQKRAEARTLTQRKKGELERHVPTSVLRATHIQVTKTWFEAAERGIFDKQTLYSSDHPYGEPPHLVAVVEKGNIIVHDEESFARFEAIGRLEG